jgi:16S rRNA processing protein RimM
VVIKPHGLKGEIAAKIDPSAADLLGTFPSLFFNLNGSMVPFVLERFAYLNQGKAKFKLSGLENGEQAEAMRGKEIFQLSSKLSVDKQLDMVGFQVCLKSGEEIGEITAVIDHTAQTLIEVSRPSGDEILIPLVDAFIVSLDSKAKRLTMELPEGLLDL